MSNIQRLQARQILDSRGNPTVEVDLFLDDGSWGRAAVPSGASTGSREALELRDGDSAYLGKGVLKAIQHIREVIAPAVEGKSFSQKELDDLMLQLDGTETKSNLGANAILAVSMAYVVAQAHAQHLPLYKYIGQLAGNTDFHLPKPIFNLLNGGAHADWTTDIQEYILFPMKHEPYAEQLRKSVEVFHHLGKILISRGYSTHVGNEGGYAPSLQSNEEAFNLIPEAVQQAGYTMGHDGDFMLGIDAAASEFFKEGMYHLKRDGATKSSTEMIAWYQDLMTKYPIFSLEDLLAEEDWDGWKHVTAQIGADVQVVGDDLTVTNPRYIQKAVDGKNCNAVIIKLNQIGTVSETLEAIRLCKAAGWVTIASHRSGETEDTFIAHLAVGAGTDQIKTGAPSRTDRTAKYNELLRIAEELL